eukprot:gnl/TRDRNA2_/TRDRNA2_83439_c3_seq1.p1 gnl/TRDRNA2_/TRDRNA2_83439_c3~~gnl/TRDRNA2_/TRDRNA2_83439_c3_seq1.p1  ORF type:complete len:328 (+),score=69.54 gnl/TRDRNA2_/TRDRNA2_83439_c3_seq1:108-986(+)
MAAVTAEGLALEYASPEMRADREVVMAALQQDAWALEFASDELKEDRELVLVAVLKDGQSFVFSGQAARGDKEIVLIAVRQNGDLLELARQELKMDKQVVLAAVAQNGWALEHAHPSLHVDRDVVLSAARTAAGALRYAPEHFLRDREILLTAAKNDGGVLVMIAWEVQDLELCLVAIRQTLDAIDFVAPHLWEDVMQSLGFKINRDRARRTWVPPPRHEGGQRPLLPQDLEKHFKALDLPTSASADAIAKRYRALARECHPDKNPADPEGAKRKFQMIGSAYAAIKTSLAF